MSVTDQIDPALERKLAQRAADGDAAAVADLYDAYERRLYGYCHRICRHPEDAQDATQEAFCNVIQRLPGLDIAKLNFGAYLFTAARNACMDIVGQRRRAEPTDEVPEDPFATTDLDIDPERAILTQDQQRAAREANDRLPESQRSVLALREVSGLSYDEIAETLGMNSNSVAQLISRARLNFYRQLRTDAVVIAPLDEAAQRAIELTVKRQDGKINSDDLDWLTAHLAQNESSRINAEAIQESAVLYRAIGPVVVLAALKEATMAQAASILEASGVAPGAQPQTGPTASGAGSAALNQTALPAAGRSNTTIESKQGAARKNRTRRIGALALLALLIALILAGVTDDNEVPQVDRAAEVAEPTPATSESTTSKAKGSDDKKSSEPQTSNSTAPNQPKYSPGSPANEDRNSDQGNDAEKKDEVAETEEQTETPPPTDPPPAEDPVDPSPTPPSKPPGGPGSICSPPYCTTPPPN